ncbi:alpha beta hydrolase family domain-containing [Trichoderma arundinaceum]|uniref:Alpha beta hydrolase family domain-containing n=1 Tax=Trichoderma arundinaceum TaxID=490622 RepID=A0A395NGZ2_TRIAR|nr:alpha beta hydrolase family domain-containing [Trichoderma arundinaceum]
MAVISSPKPHIFVIPGAWHPASCMDDFLKSLEAAGFSAQAISLRSVGNRDVTVQDDEAQVKAVVTPLIDAGEDIVIVAHSYGGVVGTGVIAGLDKRSRDAQGLKGGILGIIYLASFMPLEGETLYGLAGGKWLPYIVADNAETEGVTYTQGQKEVFYNDCSAEVAERAIASLKGHSVQGVRTSPSVIGWKDMAYNGRRGYIRCLQDNALPIKMQDQLLDRSGVEWVVRTLDASHSPFLSMPDELTGVVAEMTVEFAKN